MSETETYASEYGDIVGPPSTSIDEDSPSPLEGNEGEVCFTILHDEGIRFSRIGPDVLFTAAIEGYLTTRRVSQDDVAALLDLLQQAAAERLMMDME